MTRKYKDQFPQVTQKNKQKLKLLDKPEEINSIKVYSSLVEKIKKAEINKTIPTLHSSVIHKIISYDKNTKYITCSKDKTIIIRNSKDNSVIRTLNDHKAPVRDIILLSDGRLASTSEDNTIKIWNLLNGDCEQTLVGHSDTVYSLLQLSNPILLSGSQDSSMGIWKNLPTYLNSRSYSWHLASQVKNDKQKQAYCMTLIGPNQLGVSSQNDINIYSFNDKSFNVIKTLKGHTNWVYDIKLMKHSKNLLVSCSGDKDCRLWNISQGDCLKIFKGHTDTILSMQMLSETIFVSVAIEMIFWDIESPGIIRTMKPDQLGDVITTFMESSENELVFAGGDNFIGLIKM